MGEIWKDVLQQFKLYGIAVSAGQAAGKLITHWLFSTDESIELYYSACALYELENVLKTALGSYENSYLSNNSEASCSVFDEAYKMLLQTYLLTCDTSKEIIEVENEKGLLNTLLNRFKKEKYDDYYNSLKNIKSGIELCIEFMDTIAYNGYIDEYGGNEAQSLGIAKEPEKYSSSDANNAVINLTALSFESNNITIDKDMTLASDMHTYGSLYMKGGTLDLNGYTLTVDGNVYQKRGMLYVNGGTLLVGGDYEIVGGKNINADGITEYQASDGALKMSYEKDYILVNGNFTTYSNRVVYDNNYSNGILEIKGEFKQLGTDNSSYDRSNFNTSGNHMITAY